MAETSQTDQPPPETQDSTSEGQVASPPEASSDATATNGKNKPPRQKPTKPLATDRIKFQRQPDVLRAFVIASTNASGQPIGLSDVAPIANLKVDTISTITNFFVVCGLLKKGEGNRFQPTHVAHEYERRLNWADQDALHALAPGFEQTWFAQTLTSRLKVRGSMPANEAASVLASEAAASPDYRPQIRVMIDWLVAVGILERDGENLKLAPKAHTKPAHVAAQPQPKPLAEKPPEKAQQNDGAGNISLNVSISVPVTELKGWTPDRIQAFFTGLAQVVSAKGGAEDVLS